MRIQQGKRYAVLTGDIVGSSRLNEKDRIRLHRVMKQGSSDLRANFRQIIPFEVDIFRGDSWQLVLTEPSMSLRIGLLYRVFIRVQMKSKDMDTRLAIAIGTIDFLPDKHVSSGDGEAFRLSGSSLENMSKRRRMKFDYADKEDSCLPEAFDIIFQLIDILANDWTEKQARAIAGALRGWTQDEISRSWREKAITQQAVAQHLDRAGWEAIESAVTFFEKGVKCLIPG